MPLVATRATLSALLLTAMAGPARAQPPSPAAQAPASTVRHVPLARSANIDAVRDRQLRTSSMYFATARRVPGSR